MIPRSPLRWTVFQTVFAHRCCRWYSFPCQSTCPWYAEGAVVAPNDETFVWDIAGGVERRSWRMPCSRWWASRRRRKTDWAWSSSENREIVLFLNERGEISSSCTCLFENNNEVTQTLTKKLVRPMSNGKTLRESILYIYTVALTSAFVNK